VFGLSKCSVVHKLLKLMVESFALFPVIEFWDGFLPPLANTSSDTSKDNFKLTRMVCDLKFSERY